MGDQTGGMSDACERIRVKGAANPKVHVFCLYLIVSVNDC